MRLSYIIKTGNKCSGVSWGVSKLRDEELGMVLLGFVDYWFLSSLDGLFFVGVVEELRAVEVFLLGADEVLEVGFVLAREVDLDELVLEEVRLADVLGGPPSSVLYLALQLLFGNGLSVGVLLDYAFVGAVYVDLFQLACLLVVAVDFKDVGFDFSASGVGTETGLFVIP